MDHGFPEGVVISVIMTLFNPECNAKAKDFSLDLFRPDTSICVDCIYVGGHVINPIASHNHSRFFRLRKSKLAPQACLNCERSLLESNRWSLAKLSQAYCGAKCDLISSDIYLEIPIT